MTKRTRNKLGQFASFTLMDPKPEIFFAKATQMIFKLFMVIFLLFMVSPWLTLLLKSKKIQRLLYLIIDFCDSHFMIEEVTNGASGAKTNANDI